MPRIRTVKPEFFDDEKLGTVSRDARLIFIGLLIFADDYGVVKGNSRWLKARIFPYDDIPLEMFEGWLLELTDLGIIAPFTASEETYLYIRNFTKHQVIDRPSKSRNPEPPQDILEAKASPRRSLADDSTSPRRILADGKGREREREREEEKEVRSAPSSPREPEPAAVELDANPPTADASADLRDAPETPPAEPSQDSQPEENAQSAKPKFGPAELVALWNEAGCRPQVQKLTDDRRRKITARMRGRADPDWWQEFFEKVRGLQERGRKWLTIDWVIKNENNLLKVIEGNYDEDFEGGKKRAIAGNHQQRAAGDRYYTIRTVQPAAG